MRPIDADAFLKDILTAGIGKTIIEYSESDIGYMIRKRPTIDAAPVKHGRWERDEWGSYLRRCSVCKKSPVYKDERGNSVAVYAGVCINCGAKMDGEQNA